MTKFGKPRLKKMRRVGVDLLLTSGIRPIESKCKMHTRPGVHGAKRTRLSVYGANLRGKKSVQDYYLLLDKQLKKYHLNAVRQRKQNKEADYSLFVSLESLLSVVVWRMGFATTHSGARQLVVHKKVYVNGELQSKPRFKVKPNSVIEVRTETDEHKAIVQTSLEIASKRPAIDWVNLHTDQSDGLFKGTFLRSPIRDELALDFQKRENEVIQFYSK